MHTSVPILSQMHLLIWYGSCKQSSTVLRHLACLATGLSSDTSVHTVSSLVPLIMTQRHAGQKVFSSFSTTELFHPTSPCCIPASKVSVWSSVALMVPRYLCICVRRKARRGHFYKQKLEKRCSEGTQLEQHEVWTSTEVFAKEQVQRSEIHPCRLLCITVIWMCIQLHVNRSNSHRSGLISILAFLGKNRIINPNFHYYFFTVKKPALAHCLRC